MQSANMTKHNKINKTKAEKLLDLTLKFLFKDLFKKKSAPQIFVLIVDTLFCAISYLLVLTFNAHAEISSDLFIDHTPVKILIVTLIYFVINILVKNYKYTIRLPIIEDMYKTLELVVFSSVILVIIAYIIRLTTDVYGFSIWDIFVSGGMAFTMMMCVRLITKHLYSIHVDRVENTLPVILMGNDMSTISLALTLKNEQPRKYNPVAIITTDSHTKKPATINGLKVIPYNSENIGKIFKEYECNSLLIPDNMLESVRKKIADTFLKHNIKLYLLNHVTDYMNNTEGSSVSHVEHINIEDLLGRNPIYIDKTNLTEYFSDKVVLITGAAGSIGSEITRQVIALGAKKAVLVDQAETPMHSLMLELCKKYPSANFELLISDITNTARMEQIFEKYSPDVVLHAAAYKHVPMMEYNPIEAIRNNVMGTKIIADIAIKHNVKKFVMISTDKAVNPTNIMGATKRAAEIYVQSLFYNQDNDCPTQFITTRFGNVLGSNGSVIPLFTKQIENGGPITITHKDIIRYFMTIDEACTLVLEASYIGHGGEIFIFDMGTPMKIYDLATKMIILAGLRPGKDIKIIETGLRPGEKLYEELLYDKETSIPTSNKKIMKSAIKPYDYKTVMQAIDALNTNITAGNESQCVISLKALIPEYKSENYKWEKFDNNT